ncbi:MAG: hypothetical protein IT462_08165 [Planctomycetes bacterium]|nr:hypothetical protein [Planctomycetota bacterium]
MAKKQKVAGWYWIVSAILTPFIAAACILTGFFAYQSQSYRSEADQTVAALRRNNDQFEQMRTKMKELGDQVGFVLANPEGFIDAEAAKVKPAPGVVEEDQRPQQDRNYVYNKWREAEDLYRGGGKQVANYSSARQYLNKFEREIEKYIAYKSFQVYDVETIEIGNLPVNTPGEPGATPPADPAAPPADPAAPKPDRAVVAGDIVERPGRKRVIGELPQEAYLPAEADLEAALTNRKGGAEPKENSLKKPTVITLELIFRKQMHLLDELVSANVRQYGILIGEVTSQEAGYGAVEDRKTKLDAAISDLDDKISNRLKVDATSHMGEIATADGEIAGEANSRKSTTFETQNLLRTGQLATDAGKFASEMEMHKADADAYRDLARRIPRIKMPKAVPNSEWDGQITYSDDKRGTIHINLGRLDNVVAGQRFEVWRASGREKDVFVGMIEIVRTLSDYFSLCTVLVLNDNSLPVRKGDEILSHLWHKGKFLTVALHGTFNPPDQAYTKERLTALLQQAGCRVVEKLQPGTDLVITGSPRGLADDAWFKTARSDILVDTISEEMVRPYLQPR